MKTREIFKISIVTVIFIVIGLFFICSASAESSCDELIWEGDYEIHTLEDLEGLSGYTTVTGDLIIESLSSINLEGLECLTHVGGTLSILDCAKMQNFAGLKKLESIGGLHITENGPRSFIGLVKLKSIGGSVYIYDNKDC